jgi:CBS domain-containing protein
MAHPITEVMTPIPECCTPDDSVIKVARVIAQHDVGVVPIIESQDTRRILGIITDRDIVLRVIAERRDPGITER